jgi:hypothetical protein
MSIHLDRILEVGRIAASDLSKRHGAIKLRRRVSRPFLKYEQSLRKRNKKED